MNKLVNLTKREKEVLRTILKSFIQSAAVLKLNKDFFEKAIVLIRLGADIDTCNKCGDTLLHVVADLGDEEMVISLLEKGANIETRDSRGLTPFRRALESYHFEIYKLFLEKGADVNTRDNEGSTALHRVISGFSGEGVIQFLLDKNIDFNICDNKGRTALLVAKTIKNWSGIKLLKEKKAEE